MKLFIWEGDGVLTDYGSGLVVVLADSLEDAHKIIEGSDPIAARNIPGHPAEIVDLDDEPVSGVWLCWGSS